MVVTVVVLTEGCSTSTGDDDEDDEEDMVEEDEEDEEDEERTRPASLRRVKVNRHRCGVGSGVLSCRNDNTHTHTPSNVSCTTTTTKTQPLLFIHPVTILSMPNTSLISLPTPPLLHPRAPIPSALPPPSLPISPVNALPRPSALPTPPLALPRNLEMILSMIPMMLLAQVQKGTSLSQNQLEVPEPAPSADDSR